MAMVDTATEDMDHMVTVDTVHMVKVDTVILKILNLDYFLFIFYR
jgi:hypothetical protein